MSTPGILTINEKGDTIPAKEPLHFYEPKMKGVGPGLAFAKELKKHLPPNIDILLIPTAVGGSSIAQWLGDSTHRSVKLLTNFQEKVRIARKYGTIKAILWHQGESDANEKGLSVRQEKLSALFLLFRNFAGNSKLPILIGELGSYSKDPDHWKQMNIQSAIYAAHDQRAAVVSAADLSSNPDLVHFNAISQRQLGKRFAEAYIKVFLTK